MRPYLNDKEKWLLCPACRCSLVLSHRLHGLGMPWEESLLLGGGRYWVAFWLTLALVHFQFPVGGGTEAVFGFRD